LNPPAAFLFVNFAGDSPKISSLLSTGAVAATGSLLSTGAVTGTGAWTGAGGGVTSSCYHS